MPGPGFCVTWPTRWALPRGCRRRWRPPRGAVVGHDRGQVLVDLAVAVADDAAVWRKDVRSDSFALQRRAA